MGFIIAKTVLLLIVPPASLLIAMVVGFLIIRLRPGLGRVLIAAGFIPLYLLSISPVSNALMRPLEAAVPPMKDERVVADAIVVLGGGVHDLAWAGLPSEPSPAALARLVKGMSLYRKLHLPLVLMGGNGDPSRAVTSDADAMARVAHEAGVPAKDIILEDRSRNTIEGARALNRLIRGKRIILVTSASHMKRARAMFAKNGFAVLPAPTAYVSEQRKTTPYSFIPHAANLSLSSSACTEYLSLFWYTVTRTI
jgi:uncharacterized SAM-binding protein YcdF (DUF218 family)